MKVVGLWMNKKTSKMYKHLLQNVLAMKRHSVYYFVGILTNCKALMAKMLRDETPTPAPDADRSTDGREGEIVM